VGGVDIGGDAVEDEREAPCSPVWTVMHERVDDVDVGDVSRPAMIAGDGV
jgi:hypothetical protein